MPKCVVHRVSIFRCPCTTGGAGERPKGKAKANFTRNGREWCGTCSSLIRDGRCTNSTCSTRS